MDQVTQKCTKRCGQMHRCMCTACRVYHQSDDLKLFSSAKSMLNTQCFKNKKKIVRHQTGSHELSQYTRELFANTYQTRKMTTSEIIQFCYST